MKSKILFLLCSLLFSATTFAQEAKTMYIIENGRIIHKMAVTEIDSIVFYKPVNAIPKDGVLINGVVWAKYNVNTPGTFTLNSEDAGMLYKWNSNIAWKNTGFETGWNDNASTGDTWEISKNVCPVGWRVPTSTEIESLIDAGSIWVTQSGVKGRLFGNDDNSIFLPAAGYRNSDYSPSPSDGNYWSSEPYNSSSAYLLEFAESFSDLAYYSYNFGFSVRCVADAIINITGITLNTTTQTLAVGKQYTLTANVTPVNANEKITWTSSDNTVAIVDMNGKVTATAIGTADITAQAGNVTATCTFTTTTSPNEESVVINGVRWATRNVNTYGTFAANIEDAGMFYQWNRTQSWTTTGDVANWNHSDPAGTTWSMTNNVCPSGYRIPTSAEVDGLLSSGSEWLTINGINGRLFGSGDNTIFLPALGWRVGDDSGRLAYEGTGGYYWSNAESGSFHAYSLSFDNHSADRLFRERRNGQPVRCVADE